MYFDEIPNKMNLSRAKRIVELDESEEETQRSIAGICHEEWGEDACWEPWDNQLAGLDLIRVAKWFIFSTTREKNNER